MQTVTENTPTQINAAFYSLLADIEKKLTALETRVKALEATGTTGE